MLVEPPERYQFRRAIHDDADQGALCLFGHPRGANKPFTSALDAVPHLIWLLSESQNHDDCSCALCQSCPEATLESCKIVHDFWINHGKYTQATHVATDGRPDQTQYTADRLDEAASKTRSASARPSVDRVDEDGLGSTPDHEQCSVFRVGEMVWYRRGDAWQLAILISALGRDNTQTPIFTIAPIGHKSFQDLSITRKETEMRPFLSFSIPFLQNDYLRNKDYLDINWHEGSNDYKNALEAVKGSSLLLRLDASKMAAYEIDQSYSLYRSEEHGDECSQPTGVFLGAERVDVGGILRLGVSTITVSDGEPRVMHLKRIINVMNDNLYFGGDVYALTRIASIQADDNQLADQYPSTLLSNETRRRNELESLSQTGKCWVWNLLERDAILSERSEDIHGRFYNTDALVRLLEPDVNNFPDAYVKNLGRNMILNDRGRSDSERPGLDRHRKCSTRIGTLMDSIMVDLKIPGIVEDLM